MAATTPGIPDISIYHTPEPKGTFKVMQQKGIKITNYKEDIPKRQITFQLSDWNISVFVGKLGVLYHFNLVFWIYSYGIGFLRFRFEVR